MISGDILDVDTPDGRAQAAARGEAALLPRPRVRRLRALRGRGEPGRQFNSIKIFWAIFRQFFG